MRLHFIASEKQSARKALKELLSTYINFPLIDADIIVVLGGDGTMLQILHKVLSNPKFKDKRIFGLNRGSVGFLMNKYNTHNLEERIDNAFCEMISPLRMTATDVDGKKVSTLAVNEVSLLRQSHQAAKIRIYVDGKIRIKQLICDGVMLATPAGSTAYNFSAQGAILPLESSLLALTPVSPFRPRRWNGAILNDNSKVRFDILEEHKRPVNVSADMQEIKSVTSINIEMAYELKAKILFDNDFSWNDRILLEQFRH